MACFDNTVGTSIKDCGAAPLTGFTGTGNVVGSVSPSISTLTATGAYPQAEFFGNGTDGAAEYALDYNATQTVGATFAEIPFQAYDAGGTLRQYVWIAAQPVSNTAGAVSGIGLLQSTQGGTGETDLRWGPGVAVGTANPKGAGTLNVQNAYYANGTTGVSCSSGINATTFQSVNGIVTHCSGQSAMKALAAYTFALVFAAQQALAAGCTLPTSVSGRFGRGQDFNSGLSANSALDGTRDILWDNQSAISTPADVHAGFYMAGRARHTKPSPYGLNEKHQRHNGGRQRNSSLQCRADNQHRCP